VVMRLGPSQLMQLWVLPSASFVFFLLLSPRGALGSSSQGHHYTAKGNRARPPWGLSRGGVVCGLCVLVQILPFAIDRDNGISRVYSSE
jgi:hypothetical protein